MYAVFQTKMRFFLDIYGYACKLNENGFYVPQPFLYLELQSIHILLRSRCLELF